MLQQGLIRRTVRTLTLLCAATCAWAPPASADWLVTPFIGGAFAGKTTFVDLEQGATSTQLIVGGATAWLSDGLFGAEADLTYAPRFFERDNRAGLIVGSNASALMGSAIVAVPLAITRESLRPYAVVGLGVIHAGLEDVFGVVSDDGNLLGLNVGGGAVGFIGRRTGFRFDLRQLRTLRGAEEALSGTRRSRLSFWRATVGVTLRYGGG